MRRPDGRVVERVRLPVSLIDEVTREAERRGQPFEEVAGDLVAEALPGALQEAAKALLDEGRASLKQNPRGFQSSGALNRTALTTLPALYPESTPVDVESRSGRRLNDKAPSRGTIT
jgi:hypothetical protein